MSSCVILAGLDFRHACPGMVAERLSIEALMRRFHKVHHYEAPVASGKSGGVFLPCQKYLHHVCLACQLCVVVPLCHPCGH